MSNRLLHTEPPLTEAEKAERFDLQTTIKVEHRALRHAITRDWVNSGREGEGYGYAEKRARQITDEQKLDLVVPGHIDIVQLTHAILSEIARQQAGVLLPSLAVMPS